MYSLKFAPFVFFAFVTFCMGCGSGGGLVPVEGVVTLDGRPLPNIQVVFDQPELSANENIGYAGKTDAQGHYSLKPVGKDGEGAPPGTFRVSLSTASDSSAAAPTQKSTGQSTIFFPEAAPPPPERVPANQRQQSFEVLADGTDKADFHLKSR